jgi:DNA repair photolyase
MDPERLFELRRRTFDTPEFRGMEFIETEAKSVINHVPGNFMPFSWTINPYRGCSHACVACFARPTHTYLDMNAGRDFETKIVVKVNAPEVLRRQLASKRWKGEAIALGTNTDPYQRAEGRYRLMPGIIRAMIEYRNPFSILTRGPLMLRDLPLLVEASKVTQVSTAFSIPTLDEDAWSRTEPGSPHPRARMDAVATLNDAGIPCGVMVAPLLPGITDDPASIRTVVRAAIDAGATHVSPIMLHLRPGVREEYMRWLTENHPDLVPRYEQMYRASAYGPAAARRETARKVGSAVRMAGGLKPHPEIAARRRRSPRDEGSKPPQARQLSLLRERPSP